jgi:hypothetical protein
MHMAMYFTCHAAVGAEYLQSCEVMTVLVQNEGVHTPGHTQMYWETAAVEGGTLLA